MTSLLAITCFLLNSCCSFVDCMTSDYTGRFRIVSAASGQDLVFGPNRIYDKTQIRFYTKKGLNITLLDYRILYLPGQGYDSIFYVDFYSHTLKESVDTAYMQLTGSDVDTLTIRYDFRESTCCGDITVIENIRINNKTDMPGEAGTQEIKK